MIIACCLVDWWTCSWPSSSSLVRLHKHEGWPSSLLGAISYHLLHHLLNDNFRILPQMLFFSLKTIILYNWSCFFLSSLAFSVHICHLIYKWFLVFISSIYIYWYFCFWMFYCIIVTMVKYCEAFYSLLKTSKPILRLIYGFSRCQSSFRELYLKRASTLSCPFYKSQRFI
jgi:hypothetical protein